MKKKKEKKILTLASEGISTKLRTWSIKNWIGETVSYHDTITKLTS